MQKLTVNNSLEHFYMNFIPMIIVQTEELWFFSFSRSIYLHFHDYHHFLFDFFLFLFE